MLHYYFFCHIYLPNIKASISFPKIIPKSTICIHCIIISHCTSLSPCFIILDKNNVVKVSHHYLTLGGYQVCL